VELGLGFERKNSAKELFSGWPLVEAIGEGVGAVGRELLVGSGHKIVILSIHR
jgi:hypothetical protein